MLVISRIPVDIRNGTRRELFASPISVLSVCSLLIERLSTVRKMECCVLLKITEPNGSRWRKHSLHSVLELKILQSPRLVAANWISRSLYKFPCSKFLWLSECFRRSVGRNWRHFIRMKKSTPIVCKLFASIRNHDEIMAFQKELSKYFAEEREEKK